MAASFSVSKYSFIIIMELCICIVVNDYMSDRCSTEKISNIHDLQSIQIKKKTCNNIVLTRRNPILEHDRKNCPTLDTVLYSSRTSPDMHQYFYSVQSEAGGSHRSSSSWIKLLFTWKVLNSITSCAFT
ncbi:hypothetical protein Tcan_13825 [Toxocara canis]|uniref:Secreted protein n=1 Tax=Toxocara canis TaxID=6265 RepID=A0A0B2VPS3_TOXCA|nr:hypothetical protein Tcan_13825 [Toxocara canis]